MGATSTVGRVVEVARDRNITFLAASVAYYAFVSLIPLILLVLVVGSLVGGEAFAEFVVGRLQSALSSSGQRLVSDALTNARGRTGAGIVGAVTLAWSALRLFRGLDLAFAEAYGTPKEPSLAEQLVDGAVTVVLLVLAVGLMVAVGYFVGTAPTADLVPFPRVVSRVVLVAGLAVAFLPLYYVLPPVDLSVREALPGAVFAAVGWVALQVGFQVYAANASQYQAYGVLGAVLLLVTWLYFASILVLFGAVVNAVVAGRGSSAG